MDNREELIERLKENISTLSNEEVKMVKDFIEDLLFNK